MENLSSNNELLNIIKNQLEDVIARQNDLETNLNTLSSKMPMTIIDGTNSSSEISTDEDKIKAAYALNLCTVSVSQIIDYNDINILEQEYNAILNNLNLEYIPKDEALLNTLKILLDTITFFRIQEGDKTFIEKEYQQKMKNAIWSAVPNFGLIVAGGEPITMAISLASQIGIGYMNYRKNKAANILDKERSEWELQKSALEQFNGIRRELFDAAWRLADKYQFPDKYRLTENQIEQYNKILMDIDDYRRFERLENIKDNFEAYPPFWYYLGKTANSISQQEDDIGIKNYYRNIAVKYFDEFRKRNKYNILREDLINSACCLEYIDLLDIYEDKNKIISLLNDACKTSGNSNDILQLCALYYLKIGDLNNSTKLLRNLVNENYNLTVNAQLLSYGYVYDYVYNHSTNAKYQYSALEKRIDSQLMFPMPINDKMNRQEFIDNQRNKLLDNYKFVLNEIINKYIITFNKIFPVPDNEKEYDDDYFLDNCYARNIRKNDIINILANRNKKQDYINRVCDANIAFSIINVLNDLLNTISYFSFLESEELAVYIQNELIIRKSQLNKLVEVSGNYNVDNKINKEYINELFDSLTFKEFTFSFFKAVTKKIVDYIGNQNDMKDISYCETNLREFCLNNSIQEPNNIFDKEDNNQNYSGKKLYISDDLLGTKSNEMVKKQSISKNMIDLVANSKNELIKNPKKAALYIKGENEFYVYMNNNSKINKSKFRQEILAVLEEHTFGNCGFLFTTTGISLVKYSIPKRIVPYNEILWYDNTHSALNIKEKYKNDNLDLNVLFDLIQKLSSDK